MSLFFWAMILLACVVVYRLQRLTISTIVAKHRFALYGIRDDLRLAAIDGKVDPKNWVFQYLDSTISKMATGLSDLTIWSVLATYIAHRRNSQHQRAANHLQVALSNPQNSILAEFYLRFVSAIGLYTLDRHLSLRILFSSLLMSFAVVRFLKAKLERIVRTPAEAPETSTLYEYA